MSIPAFPLTPEVLSYKAPEPALSPFEPPKDRALFADPKKKSLSSLAAAVKDLTPDVRTELEGVQLHQLTDEQRDAGSPCVRGMYASIRKPNKLMLITN
jgi:sulfonate dioxygenase